MTPAILFEPDGYVLSGDRLMGRQSAGEGFLRAVIGAMHGSSEVWAYTPKSQSAEIFSRVIRKHDPGLTARWCRSDNVAQLANLGGLYLPGPDLSEHAQRRARIGHAAYSLTGITHTIASHRAMDAIGSVLTAPVMPWDALICTSTAAVETVRILLSEQASLLRWRFGKELDFTLPLTPVIPLGVHLDDFAYVAKNRDKARAELGLDEDAIVLLFSGRLAAPLDQITACGARSARSHFTPQGGRRTIDAAPRCALPRSRPTRRWSSAGLAHILARRVGPYLDVGN